MEEKLKVEALKLVHDGLTVRGIDLADVDMNDDYVQDLVRVAFWTVQQAPSVFCVGGGF